MAGSTSRAATAAANGDLSGLKYLIDNGENINVRSSDGMTPLAIAAFWGYADVVEFLLENRADVNLTNKGNNWTPLHCASFQGHGKVILNLMQHTPDLYIKDNLGRTAVDFASALDAVWSFFGAAGCKRTSKSDLIRMDIVKRVKQNDPAIIPSSERVHFSRPGSAYVINSEGYTRSYKDHNMVMASVTGDVLAGLPEDKPIRRANYKPTLSLLQN
ncbi:serine/threonine-protein kinase TNNI3K [Patella vulgata]|uniref:serine/threonine-protein kinase TNNI3K n=1 Tax=Patella vulgata TaxID=6465 RepID=UPI00217F3E49|nr:serine/threonine-protein kinase TNNI3K [Patella vulgata]